MREIAIHQRGAGDIWQGLWEPYLSKESRVKREEHSTLLAKDVKHVLTHRILYADFYLLEPSERPTLPEDYIWIKESEIERYALPRLVEKLFALLPKQI